ncbi:hypothetical protein EZV62_024548 [Acer yangbiense]|uniref:Uncharacterized protein n=1 Tax=Acer yangbiense TaxID=1000413 RepID=A0A5C7GVE6_9ROSI|nr:hypothetical protein EZV62_024548 [Acer yangbiense]
MGIPSFYRWVTERYPKCVVSAREDSAVDTTRPNPNGLEFDNLYLDLNGIIHPCFHPQGLPAPKTHEEVFEAIYKYIDRIFSIIRPRKLLFLAIDGVAPRAKMNQQRSRRFKAAKDASDNALGTERLRKAIELEGKPSENLLDSNVITPGTEFMDLLSSALRYYIHLRMNDNLGWRVIKVVLSDASVPGEGEHKIMSYIRLQRNMPGYDPNTRHCLYGLDADLIMLALATHEIHFSVLREFVNIWILREYLAYDMKIPSSTVEANSERLIDDFVFMCLFVGNDFLPQIPSLEISEGAINLLMRIYSKEFSERGGYLTNSFEVVNLSFCVSVVITSIGCLIQHILMGNGAKFLLSNVRMTDELLKPSNLDSFNPSKLFETLVLNPKKILFSLLLPPGDNLSNIGLHILESPDCEGLLDRGGVLHGLLGWRIAGIHLRQWRLKREELPVLKIEKVRVTCSQGLLTSKLSDDSSKVPFVERNTESRNQDSPIECEIPPVSQDPQNIELGWKERYYTEKFEAKLPDDRERVRRHAVTKYIEGICWVMHYYYEGVCSWQWFYPYHYAPLASDFNDISQLKFHFTLGEPFKPFDQLLGVLPAASAHALPLFYRKLMTDVLSPILDLYPTDFELDMNGKRFAWQAICKLPFIEESRLLSETAKLEHTLTDEERRRNSLGLDILFLHISHPLAVEINSFSKQMNDSPEFIEVKVEKKIDPKFSGGMSGYIYISDKSMWPVEIPSAVQGMKMIAKNEVLFVFYKNPSFHSHIPRLLPGVMLPEKSVGEQDILLLRGLRHKSSGRFITKLVSGSILAKFAHSLVSQNILGKQPQILQSMKLDYNVGPDGLKERKQRNIKRKLSEGDGVHVGADALVNMKSEEDRSGEKNVNNIVGKLESSVVMKLTEATDDLTGVDGLKEIKEVDHMKRKRKRKSKKMRQSAVEGILNNNVEKLGGCVLADKSKAEADYADQDMFEELKNRDDDVSHKIVGTLESSSSREHNANGGNHDQASAHGLQEIKVEIESRKKKRKPKKKKLNKSDSEPNNIVEKLESYHLQEKSKADEELNVKGDSASDNIVEKLESFLLFKADNHNADQYKFEELKVKGDSVPHNIVEKLESRTLGEQSNSKGEHAIGGEGETAAINGPEELKAEVESKSKKRSRKSKRRKLSEADYIPNNIVEKLEIRSTGVQNLGNDQVSADGLQEIKAEVGSMKRKLNTMDAAPIDVVGKMESSQIEKRDSNGEHTSAVGLQEIKAEVGSKKKKRRSKKRKLNTTDAAPNDIVGKMESSHMEKRDSNGEHTGAVELKEMKQSK